MSTLYTPLAKCTREIRLLQILPGPGLIQLTSQTYNLEESPDFVALSYEWKGKKRPRIVRLNGMAFRIRRNLWEALLSLREFQSHLFCYSLFVADAPFFWIDAVCINQADDPEKCHQVAMMRDIFCSAFRTVAWIGPEIAETDLAFDDKVYVPETEKKQLSVSDLYGRTYFIRVSIVQEIVLSKRVSVMCGG